MVIPKNRFRKLREIHGRVHEFFLSAADRVTCWYLFCIGRIKSVLSKSRVSKSTDDYNVDFVVTWVDGKDPNWLKDKQQYTGISVEENVDDSDARYREWDVFKYWFRSIEQYAPWVHTVFLVTYGHVPPWLNLNHPKLRVVPHTEFISKEFLPTFSSHAIEISLQNIESLSEHFVYFNDDFYLTSPTEKKTFFKNGLPKYCGVAVPVFPYPNMNAHGHSLINSIGLINSAFNIRDCIRQNPDKWFSYKYGDRIKYNIRAFYDNKLMGMFFSHLATPYRKSTMKEVSKRFPEQFKLTQSNRIRKPDNIMHQIFQSWEICNGSYEPVSPQYYGKLLNLSIDRLSHIQKEVFSPSNYMVCINDNENISADDFIQLKKGLVEMLDRKYPDKSGYEL